MRAFIVTAPDRAGSGADILGAVAAAGVDLKGVAGLANGTTGMIALIPDDEAACRNALAGTGATVRESELVITEVETAPGSAARLAGRLADAGLDLTLMLPVGMNGERIEVAVGATDPQALRRALG
jgi:hypothetical protein